MPKVFYSFRPQAWKDAVNLSVYIGQNNLKAGIEFLDALENTCKIIASAPLIGSRRSYSNKILHNIRMLPIRKFPSYLIFYQPLKNGVDVIRIVHGARDLPRLFS